jgi:hypothetical protein
VLALIAVTVLLTGGSIWSRGRKVDWLLRVMASVAIVAFARWAGGPAAAALVAVLLAIGALLQVRLGVAISGLAVFGTSAAILGRGDVRIILVFWFMGLCGVLARSLVRRGGASRTREAVALGPATRSAGPVRTVAP